MTYHGTLTSNLRTYLREDSNAMRPLLIYDGDDIPAQSETDVECVNFRRMALA